MTSEKQALIVPGVLKVDPPAGMMIYMMKSIAKSVGRVALSDGELAVLDALDERDRIVVTESNMRRVKFGLLNLAQRALANATSEQVEPEARAAARRSRQALLRSAKKIAVREPEHV